MAGVCVRAYQIHYIDQGRRSRLYRNRRQLKLELHNERLDPTERIDIIEYGVIELSRTDSAKVLREDIEDE